MSANRTIEAKGKTVDEAIVNGLGELGLEFDQVTVEILHEGSRRIFGLGKSASVRLTEKHSLCGDAEAFLNGLFSHMHIPATATAAEEDDGLKVNITGDSTGVLIGRRGETLDALQYLTSLVVNRHAEGYHRVMLDTENYRKKREDTLVRLAGRIAGKVVKTGRRVVLEPMNPYERRVLHATLQNDTRVETLSEGEEPYRRVVVRKRRG